MLAKYDVLKFYNINTKLAASVLLFYDLFNVN